MEPATARLNFLKLLRAGYGDYVVNAPALEYMRARAMAGPLVGRPEHPDCRFADAHA
jgi:hypothetical protein